MSEDIQETPSSTPNFKTELAKQLEQLAPEAIADGKVDVQKLKELLDEDAVDESERFGLFWPGKLRAIRAAQEPTTATLKPEPELSKDWDTTKNVFIEGDNLEALKILQKHYHGKIKMIYIDPPYNTGKDFVYPDNYKEGLKTYLEWTKQVNEQGQKVKSNPETDGRYHSHWLNMMYPRLKLARSLLTDDGVIFISIDDSEQAQLKEMCDEIFLESNFIATIVVNRTSEVATGNIIQKHEYTICYCRNCSSFAVNGSPKFSISRGTVGNLNQTQPIIEFPVGIPAHRIADGVYKETRKVDGSNENIENLDEIVIENGKLAKPVRLTARWRSSNDMRNFFANNCRPTTAKINGVIEEIYFESDRFIPQIKKSTYEKIPDLILKNSRGSKDLETLNLSGFFENPKSVQLLKCFIKLISQRNDIILDFFSGSSTTAHAVMQLNAEDGGSRRHIQVQLPEPVNPDSPAGKAGFKTIADISRKRIDSAGEKIKKDYAEQLAKRDTPLDVGYRAYSLTDTNFSKWRETSATDATTLEQRMLDLGESADDNASELALLTEVLLKQGYSLTESVRKETVAGLDVWSVADGLVLAYMDEQMKPTLEQLRALVDREPERLIVLEDAFQGDDELKTNLVQAAKTRHVELWTA